MKAYYIDKNGDIVLPLTYAQDARKFSEGLAVFRMANNFCGFINKSGKIVIEPIYFYAGSFSEGLAIVQTQDNAYFNQRFTKFGAIDKEGNLIFEGEYDCIFDFSKGVAVAQKGEKFFFLNKKGEKILTIDANIQFNLEERPKFSEGLVPACDTKTWKCGFMDKTGQFVIEPKFVNAANFSEGLARVSIEENSRHYLGFINPQGEYVIEPRFEFDYDFLRCTTDFSEGLASLVDAPLMMDKDMTFFYIDKTGEIVLHPNFFRAEQFSEGLAAVWDEHTEKSGYIDKKGNLVIPLKFEFADAFSEGLAYVVENY